MRRLVWLAAVTAVVTLACERERRTCEHGKYLWRVDGARSIGAHVVESATLRLDTPMATITIVDLRRFASEHSHELWVLEFENVQWCDVSHCVETIVPGTMVMTAMRR